MRSNYNKCPAISLDHSTECFIGWESIGYESKRKANSIYKKNAIIVVDFYQGILKENVRRELQNFLRPDLSINAEEAMYDEVSIHNMVYPDATDDRVFRTYQILVIERFKYINNEV
ncbi:MAG: hypothetical protein K9G38_04610 [Bacteroidales bacterium]|nr:hypothetical protein [Bacteroidales bacterium]